ncbi:hypothetical protein NP603_19095 [Methylomonas sp. SURF-1]|uniref:Uncharacterized protein n=1 Tax=Methylomonas aurea TaxID=2952224 RepID=A0ABT1UN33_9GAMM|nr:hypothetical protein [Methylomonas sp. SURF-1]MCQ8183228.1 hypothetical protein [Methylomonas sp. SURF-1]
MARRESTNDREGYACLRNHHARHRSGFASLTHWKKLNLVVIGVTSRKVGGNLGDINLIQDTFHSRFTDHVVTGPTAATFADAYAGHALIVNIQNNAASSASYRVWTNKLTLLEQFNWWMFNSLPTGVVANDQAWRMTA